MSLRFYFGPSGSGKSHRIYEEIMQRAAQEPGRNFLIIVPDQFTMQTQKDLVMRSDRGGILNIDVLSFGRLSHRILEEVGTKEMPVLDDTGKSLVLQKIAADLKEQLPAMGSLLHKQGYIHEVKSAISEFMQYGISTQDMDKLIASAEKRGALAMKLRDLKTLYRGFQDYIRDHFITTEETLDVLRRSLVKSKILPDSVVVFDGFTGFTPIQNRLIQELMRVCEETIVTVTIGEEEDPYQMDGEQKLFHLSKKTVADLVKLAAEAEVTRGEDVFVKGGPNRFTEAPALCYLEQNLFRYQYEPYTEKQCEIRMFEALSPREEVHQTALYIQKLIREEGLTYRDIAVVIGDLEGYASYVETEFGQLEIPCFLDRTRGIVLNPMIEYIKSALQLYIRDFSYDTVFHFLRSGMADISREEIDELENYVIRTGARGYRTYSRLFTRRTEEMQQGSGQEDTERAEETLERLNRIRQQFADTVEILHMAPRAKAGEYVDHLYDFLEQNQVQQKLLNYQQQFEQEGDLAKAREYAQIYRLVMDLLDQIYELLGEEEISLQEFADILEAGFGEITVGTIPQNVDRIVVGDMERTRLKQVKVLFFLGVNDGNIPKNASKGGIISDMDREFLIESGTEMAPSPRQQMYIQRLYLYLNMTKPGEKLILSYSDTNAKGEGISPAYLIGSIRSLYPKLGIEGGAGVRPHKNSINNYCYPENPEAGIDLFLEKLVQETEKEHEDILEQADETDAMFGELYSWYLRNPEYRSRVQKLVQSAFAGKPEDIISQSVAKALYGEVSPYSATRLERFAACAFAHFLQYGMKLTERVEYEFKPMDMGNVMHEALESFAEEVRKRGMKWTELTEQERNEIADRCLDNIVADYGNTVLKSSARNEYMIERTRRILRRTVWALQKQLEQGEFQPEGFEVTFGGGRIDRVDIMEDQNKVYVKVIDYKTGNTSFDLVYLYHGLQLQLMIYLDGALRVEQKKYPDKEIIPAGVFYYNIKDPMIQEKIDADVEAVSAGLMKELKMNGLAQADPELVYRMDSSLGSIPVAFNKDGSFRKNSSVADRTQFAVLGRYVRTKIEKIRSSILEGDAEVSPYELGKKNACTYCPYMTVCGFDRRLSGYEFRRLKNFSDEELWKAFDREAE